MRMGIVCPIGSPFERPLAVIGDPHVWLADMALGLHQCVSSGGLAGRYSNTHRIRGLHEVFQLVRIGWHLNGCPPGTRGVSAGCLPTLETWSMDCGSLIVVSC